MRYLTKEPTGVKGAAGALGRVEDAADVCGAGGGGGRRRGERGAGRVGCRGGAALCLAVGDAAVADLARLVL